MPPKPSTNKRSTTTASARGKPSTSQDELEVCSLCCRAIVEGKEEALLCEGEQSCNRWMHRYCAGVSVEHYKSLDQSPLPFNCSLCVQRKQAAQIDELKSMIAVLTAEVAELRAAMAEQQQPVPVRPNINDNVSRWSDVVTRRPRKGQAQLQDGPAPRSKYRTSNGDKQDAGAAGAGGSRVLSSRVTVPGVKRVWGTKKDASTTVVLQTIRQLTKIDPEKKLTVKRKFKEGDSGRRDRWWFLVRGSEAVLEELECLWSNVALQVGWKLEVCTKPSDDDGELDAGSNATESDGAKCVESESASNTALNSSDCPPCNTNSPEMSTATCSSQPNDTQTSSATINENNINSSQHDSNAHASHRNPASIASTNNNTFLDK